MSKLQIGPGLTLPLEAVTERLAFLGRTGSGKSYAAQKLAEEMHRAGAQFIALDPVGVWWALRLAANGKDPGIPIPVFGGLRGDVPIEPTAGNLIADLIVDRGISCVIDVSQFESDADKARFAKDFASRFYFRKKASPSAVHIFFEEAQEFFPQNPMKGDQFMLHAFTRIVKIGRNFGIGGSLISQRGQEVNKKVLNLIELLFAFQTTGPHERKAIEGWISEKGIDEDIAAELPKLKRGHAHAWSPAWLNVSKEIAIGEKWTFDGSSTPKVGAGGKRQELAPIDIEALGEQIKASVERAKADDPKELRKQLAERDKTIRHMQKGGVSEKIVEKPVRDEAAIERAVATAIAGERRKFKPVLVRLQKLSTALTEIPSAIGDLAKLADAPAPAITATLRPFPAGTSGTVMRPTIPAQRAQMAGPDTAGEVSGVQQRILNTICALDALGVKDPDRATVAALVGYHPNAKSYANAMGGLRTSGRVEYPAGGSVRLTDNGRAIAENSLTISTLEELHDVWRDKLGNVATRILNPLIDAYPDDVDTAAVADSAGYHPNAKSFANMKGRLRTLGLIDYPGAGRMAATKVLFPEGLA